MRLLRNPEEDIRQHLLHGVPRIQEKVSGTGNVQGGPAGGLHHEAPGLFLLGPGRMGAAEGLDDPQAAVRPFAEGCQAEGKVGINFFFEYLRVLKI